MRIEKKELCESCLKIRHTMDDGSLGMSIEELLYSKNYINGSAIPMINEMALYYLQENNGCSICKNLFERAI